MRKLALVALGIAGFAGPVIAADMPVKAVAPAPSVPVYSWTGCYVSGGGGYGMSNSDDTTVSTATGVAVTNESTNGGRGWFGTVGAGCDYQFGQRWVFGAFGDIDFGDISGEAFNGSNIGGLVGEEQLDWSWGVGVRFGWLPFERLLTYFSVGYTEAHFDQINYNFYAAPFTSANRHRADRTVDGWFIGTGYEYNLGWFPGLFWKTEYRFATYDADRSDIIVTSTGALAGNSVDSDKYVHTVRSQLVWRFNW